MTWKAVGPVVQKVVSRIVDTGDAGAATPAVSRKRTPTKAGAKGTGRHVREVETTLQILPTIGRDRRTGEHPQLGHAPAPLVRRSMLTVVEGGRTTQGRKLDRPAYRDGSWRERARETGLRVVG